MLLYDWNATAARLPRDRLIHDLFEEQVARTPDAPARRLQGAHADLRRIERTREPARAPPARPRREAGGASRRLMERSLEMVVGLLAVLKAGGAYVPIDP